MSTESERKPTFWGTVALLLAATRKRSAGRRARQQQLLQNRSAGKGTDWSGLGSALFGIFMIALNGIAAGVLTTSVDAAQRVEIQRQGKIVVSGSFLELVNQIQNPRPDFPYYNVDSYGSTAYTDE